MVHLQGWGEPLLHPEFFEIARIAKAARCSVGTTTNGMQFDDEKTEALLACGVDLVAFSLAGTDEKNNEIRVRTRLETVLQAIRALNTAKKEHNATEPAIHVAYLLLRSGMRDVQALPDLLDGLGVDQVVISALDFVPAGSLEDEALLMLDDKEYHEIRYQLDRVVAAGERQNLKVHYHLPFFRVRRQNCVENVRQALFVSADGSVSPCAFTGIPVSRASHMIRGAERPYRRLTFGNINHQTLRAIWRGKAYSAFRNAFLEGELPETCRDCPKIYVKGENQAIGR